MSEPFIDASVTDGPIRRQEQRWSRLCFYRIFWTISHISYYFLYLVLQETHFLATHYYFNELLSNQD